MPAVNMNEEDFDSNILNGTGKAIADFHASWCGPCKMLDPIIEDLADELGSQAFVGKVDIDECSDIAINYNVSAVPTIIFFNNGEEAARLIGYQTRENLLETLSTI
jgi:thioredoxin 1